MALSKFRSAGGVPTSALDSSHYSISVVDGAGKLSLLHIEAADEKQAKEMASAGGKTVIRCDCQEVAGPHAWLVQLSHRLKKPVSIDTVVFSQDMATLMDAGVTVTEAISALAAKEPSRDRLRVLEAIKTSISQGRTFSEALRLTRAFPELLVATIAASEDTGDLATGLSRYAKHQQSLRAVRDRVVGACVYPLLLLAVGSMVVALLLGVVVPRFATLIGSTNKELPLLSRILMSWGQFVDAQPWLPMALLAAIVGGMVAIYFKLRDAQTLKRWLNKIPGVANVVREFQHLQMYRTTAILTSRGIAIHKALVYSLDFLNAMDQSRLRAALVDMQQGVSVSDALSKSGLSDGVAVSMLNVAERTGAMPEMLDRIADFHERTLQRSIDIVSRLIEPLLMIFLGFVIGGIVVLMYLPIFDLASSIS